MKPEQSLQHEASRTVAFRLSNEDFARFQILADASGKVRQDFIRDCVLECKVTVYPNIRVRKYLEQHLQELTGELKRVKKADGLTPDLLDRLDCLLKLISQL